jgi:hypothetical protein
MCLHLVDTFRSSSGGAKVQNQLAMENRRVADCSVWVVRKAAKFRSGDRHENLYDGGEVWSLYMIL